jgi:uncharacterized protein (DUF1697 family)
LETLYTQKAARHFNLNIKVNDKSTTTISTSDLQELIQSALKKHFAAITDITLVHRQDWEKVMPIANESFVESIRNKQGENHHYYAGDFMGCPSMETALNNGKQAAEQLMKDVNV